MYYFFYNFGDSALKKVIIGELIFLLINLPFFFINMRFLIKQDFWLVLTILLEGILTFAKL